MRIRWRGFELPNRIEAEKETLTDSYGKFVVEPFERGYGVTIGNSLRRVLISSLEGAAVTSVKIKTVSKDDDGKDAVTLALHEFMGLKGVREDVTDIILNIKQLKINLFADEPRVIKLVAVGPGEVSAGMIDSTPDYAIANPDQVICTLTENVEIDLELVVKKGRGYLTAEENKEADMEADAEGRVPDEEIGVIRVDSRFSPVQRVRYKTENTRVGQKTDFDKLTLEVWTDGTKTPEMALVEASSLLRKHLNPFVKYFELGKEAEHEGEAIAIIAGTVDSEIRELKEKLLLPVSVLDPSVRSSNCLNAADIRILGELAIRSEQDMMKIKNFGKGSLKEIKKKLSDHGLSFGMELPDDVVALVKERAGSKGKAAE